MHKSKMLRQKVPFAKTMFYVAMNFFTSKSAFSFSRQSSAQCVRPLEQRLANWLKQ